VTVRTNRNDRSSIKPKTDNETRRRGKRLPERHRADRVIDRGHPVGADQHAGGAQVDLVLLQRADQTAKRAVAGRPAVFRVDAQRYPSKNNGRFFVCFTRSCAIRAFETRQTAVFT